MLLAKVVYLTPFIDPTTNRGLKFPKICHLAKQCTIMFVI